MKVSWLKCPTDSDSPGGKKARRWKVPDGLFQSRLQDYIMKFLNLKKIPSEGASKLRPSGGPLMGITIEKERGSKRGLGDQMGGPAGKKMKGL